MSTIEIPGAFILPTPCGVANTLTVGVWLNCMPKRRLHVCESWRLGAQCSIALLMGASCNAILAAIAIHGWRMWVTCAITHMRQPWIAMAAKIALQDAPISSAIEHCAPSLQLSHTCRRLFGMQFSHTPTVKVLATPHGVGKMNAPGISIVDIGESGSDATLSHHRMGLAEQRLGDHSNFDTGGRGFCRSAQPGAARSNDQNVVLMGQVLGHYRILQSVQMPKEHRRTYKSANPTEKRLSQANNIWRRLRQLTQS